MNTRLRWKLVWALALLPVPVIGLTRTIVRDIEFPKMYDKSTAAAIRQVIQNERFHFVDGHVSYWPPDWGTRLSFEGDAASLTAFMAELRRVPGMKLQLISYRGTDKERRRDTTWQLNFSHARPDLLTVYLNVNSTNIDFSKIEFPVWEPQVH